MNLQLAPEIEDQLRHFKKLYDTVVGEEASYDEFINAVIRYGLEAMLKVAIPEGEEWPAFYSLFQREPASGCELMIDRYKNCQRIRKKK